MSLGDSLNDNLLNNNSFNYITPANLMTNNSFDQYSLINNLMTDSLNLQTNNLAMTKPFDHNSVNHNLSNNNLWNSGKNNSINILKKQIFSNLTNLDEQIRLNELIGMIKSKISEANQFKVQFLDLNVIYRDVQIMLKEFKNLMIKIINSNDQLEKKQALAQTVNQSVVELPRLFDEMIEHFQDNESLTKLKNDLEQLNGEINELNADQKINNNQINECLNEQDEQRSKKVKLNQIFECLDLNLNELMIELEKSKQIKNRINDESKKTEDDYNLAQTNLIEVNNNLFRIQKQNEEIRVELNEKFDLFNKLKDKKQSLQNGTYLDDETKKLKIEIEKKKDELKEKCLLIEEVKNMSASQSELDRQITITKLKDDFLSNKIKPLLDRLNELIELNYRDKYLVFEDYSESK